VFELPDLRFGHAGSTASRPRASGTSSSTACSSGVPAVTEHQRRRPEQLRLQPRPHQRRLLVAAAPDGDQGVGALDELVGDPHAVQVGRDLIGARRGRRR
jgi:hypothetical protein